MSILITGATGYIGSMLTFKLADRGHDIRILCRQKPSDPAYARPNVTVVPGDINDPSSLAKATKGVDQVYHMAAFARLWARDKDTFRRINVEGTRNVLEAARNAGVKKVVYTSTAGVIGPSNGGPMTEDRPRITGFFNQYESTKSESEALARDYSANGLPVVITNPSRVYGPGLDTVSNPVTKIVERYVKGDWKVIPGSGNDVGSYCYVEDVVDGHVGAMEKGRGGERYIMGGVNATFNELIATVSRLSGVQQKMWHLPFPLIKAFSHLQMGLASLTGRPPLITPDWVAKYEFDWALDSGKAERELGYRIRPLEEGIAETIAWIRENRRP
jgi:nucleoside-diphosphate-sugar epimerase